MAVVALKARLCMEAVAVRALLFAAVIHVRIGIHLRGAFGYLRVGAVAAEAGLLGRSLHFILVAGLAGELRMRAVDLGGHRSGG